MSNGPLGSPKGRKRATASTTPRTGENMVHQRNLGPMTLQERNGLIKRKFYTDEKGYDLGSLDKALESGIVVQKEANISEGI